MRVATPRLLVAHGSDWHFAIDDDESLDSLRSFDDGPLRSLRMTALSLRAVGMTS